MLFTVYREETYARGFAIEASDEATAAHLVRAGFGKPIDGNFTYLYTRKPWSLVVAHDVKVVFNKEE